MDVRMVVNGGTAVLCLSRPRARNAIRSATLAELHSCLRALTEDVRAVVLEAEPPAFCAGVDLEEAARLSTAPAAERREFVEQLQDLTRTLRSLSQVTIAAVDGVAVGLGAELAIACDVRYAGDDARFSFPELKRGLFPTNGVTVLLAALVGAGRAHELLLGGEWLDADAAHAIGLAQRARGSAGAAAAMFASAIADGDVRATRLAVRALRAPSDEAVEYALQREAASALELTEQ